MYVRESRAPLASWPCERPRARRKRATSVAKSSSGGGCAEGTRLEDVCGVTARSFSLEDVGTHVSQSILNITFHVIWLQGNAPIWSLIMLLIRRLESTHRGVRHLDDTPIPPADHSSTVSGTPKWSGERPWLAHYHAGVPHTVSVPYASLATLF